MLTAEQYMHLDAAFDRDDMDRWQAGVKAATTYRAESREQRAWYLARHAAQHVLEERDDLPGNPNYYAGYVAAAICYRHLLTKEQFDDLIEPCTKVVGPL